MTESAGDKITCPTRRNLQVTTAGNLQVTRSPALPAEFVDQVRDQTGPSGLVAGADARAVVAVEMLVEQQVVAPVRIVLELLHAAENRALAVLVAFENLHQPLGDLLGHLGGTQLRHGHAKLAQ